MNTTQTLVDIILKSSQKGPKTTRSVKICLTLQVKWIFKRRILMFRHIEGLEKTGLVTAGYACGTWKTEYEGAAACYAALSEEIGVPVSKMIRSCSTHSAIVKAVGKKDGGYGVITPFSDGDSFDGMITDEPGILLCTTEADCTPVYLLDPEKRVIGMVHSGWKGTAGRIAANAVKLMEERYGCCPGDILTYIGPCMCGKCYEVGEELIEHFRSFDVPKIFAPGRGDKYFLDMPAAIREALGEVGVPLTNIKGPDACTYEDESLCSWRRTKDKTRHILTVIGLKES